jgi:hypothetical protein
MDLHTASAFWKLDLLSAHQMRAVAEDLLSSGEDTKELSLLAGLADSELSQAPELFTLIVRWAGKGDLTRADAARSVTRSIAVQISRAEIAPYEGARQIWRASLAVRDENFHDVDPFIYAASEYENRPEDRAHFAQEILSEAQRWLTK